MSKKKRCEQPEEKAGKKKGKYTCKKCGLKADNPKKLCKPE